MLALWTSTWSAQVISADAGRQHGDRAIEMLRSTYANL